MTSAKGDGRMSKTDALATVCKIAVNLMGSLIINIENQSYALTQELLYMRVLIIFNPDNLLRPFFSLNLRRNFWQSPTF